MPLKAKHILVQHKYEAEDLLKLIQKGQEFETLARKYSLCSSANSGGDLGDLSGKKNVDSDFMETLETLKVGQVSTITRTKFGYHLILRY